MIELSAEEVALRIIRLRNDTRTREHERAIMKRKMNAARIIEDRKIQELKEKE